MCCTGKYELAAPCLFWFCIGNSACGTGGDAKVLHDGLDLSRTGVGNFLVGFTWGPRSAEKGKGGHVGFMLAFLLSARDREDARG